MEVKQMAIDVGSISEIRTVSFPEVEGENEKVRIFKNPFHNLLELVKCYYDIYKTDDVEKMKLYFAAYSEKPEDEDILPVLQMYQCFVTRMFLNSIDPGEDTSWMDFDSDELCDLLKDRFFDEYKETTLLVEKMYKRKYPFLDVYCFMKMLSITCTKLPQEETLDINYIWTYEDFIDNIYALGWHKIIETVYEVYGVHWFSNNGENDPIMYKWACYAIASCKKTGNIDSNKLKRDLTDMYKELLIAFAIRDKVKDNADIIEYVQECINNFDDERINSLVSNVKTLERENEQLIDEKKQLTVGFQELQSQVKELQEDSAASDDEKVEEIARRIYCLSPQNETMDSKVANFKDIWNRLDGCTKKDIKVAISMFENFESFDLALFPLIRSLEHEFDRNFFEPFRHSKEYAKADKYYSGNKRYEKTHDALVGKGGAHPTMGSIPFIGNAINDIKAKEASQVIAGFSRFLGKEKSNFSSICKSLGDYKIGTQKLKLVEIRNGIAHGDDGITSKVDKDCYEQVSKMLYEPPMQLLFQIIKSSIKNG
jgi:hypothetical protein